MVSSNRPVITPQQRADVRGVLEAVVPGAQYWMFGSRATGRARPYSDLDVVIDLPQRLTALQRMTLQDRFEASTLPFCVDVVEAQALPAAFAQRVLQERVPL